MAWTSNFRLAVGFPAVLVGMALITCGLVYWDATPRGDHVRVGILLLHSLEIYALPTVILYLGGGRWLDQRAQQREDLMHQTIKLLMDGDLRQRLPNQWNNIEMSRLASGVNQMLARFEDRIGEIKGVGNGIAHDLRAPLTRVRNHLARSQVSAQNGIALQHTIETTVTELDQCLRSITALLRLGEMENGRRTVGFAAINLTDIAADLFDAYEAVAEEKQITLHFNVDPRLVIAGHWDVDGDRDLLIEAVGNLLDNAIKFTPRGGQVGLDVGIRDDRPFVRVADDGPGIGKAEQQAVLCRYYRADHTRHNPGHGLGLSLVAAIARLHQADIVVEDGSPGAVFTLHFPLLAVTPQERFEVAVMK